MQPSGRKRASALSFEITEVAATGLFGFEGAAIGALAGLDLLGVIVVGMCSALAGGVLRDILLGDIPPAAFRSPRRIIVAFCAALLGFAVAAAPGIHPDAFALNLFDALALSLFAATGAQKAFERDANGWVVVILGTIAATGGSVARDLLINQSPVVLTTSVYATAAAAGAAIYFLCAVRRVPAPVALMAAIGVAFGLRVAALVWNWQLPHLGVTRQ
ncbi:trimeric intracellular cation channel family protein [Plantibacter sp. YIM 135347]|uniref:trimeric intracellular cation channel family protein n=1 Tax=Plantibacter sp. YIM 135347 TaxID=3423919 RepID=UPI003D34FEA7